MIPNIYGPPPPGRSILIPKKKILKPKLEAGKNGEIRRAESFIPDWKEPIAKRNFLWKGPIMW